MTSLAWYIDALDARAGRAFASWRRADLLDAECLDEFRKPFFVEPPDFRSQPLGGAAVGLAATRGSFQAGLFITGQEVPFPSAASVSEFVRRAYISGGGGAAPGGGGVSPPPIPPEEGPRGEPPEHFLRTTDRGPDDTLLALAEEVEARFQRFVSGATLHAEVARGLRIGQVGEPWTATSPTIWRPSASASVPSDRLSRAGGALLLELFDRYPGLSSTPQQYDAWFRWHASARALFAICDRLRVFDWFHTDQYGSSLCSDVLRAIFQRNKRLQSKETVRLFSTELPEAIWLFRPALAGTNSPNEFISEFAASLEEALYRYRYYDTCGYRLHNLQEASIPEDLHRIIVPRWLASEMDFGPQVKDVDLMHFLMRAAGRPDSIEHPTESIQAARSELLLLVASAIVSQPLPSRRNFAGSSGSPGWIRRDAVAWYHVVLANEALTWIEGNAPTAVFAQQVEDALAAARSLTYA